MRRGERNTESEPANHVVKAAALLFAFSQNAFAQQADKISSYALPLFINNLICLAAVIIPAVMAILVIGGGLMHVIGGEQSRARGKRFVTGSIIGYLVFIVFIGLVNTFFPYINLDNCIQTKEKNRDPIADARTSYKKDPVIYKFTYVTIGNKVYFDGSRSYDPDGTITKYRWDLGDGTARIDPVVDHIYRDEGIYYAILTVEDNSGAVSSPSTVVVIVNPPLEAEIITPSDRNTKKK